MVKYASVSKQGDRPVNEDSVGALERGGNLLFALADGLGGHGGGDIASALAVSKVMEIFEASPENVDLAQCFMGSQNALLNEQRRRGLPGEMKTTLILLWIGGNTAKWGYIGDSRLYLFNGGKLSARTKDHSVPQMLVNAGEIREKDIRFHPDRNRLLRVMGTEWDSIKFELDDLNISPGMSFLLCSDGFWELIDEKDVCRALKTAHTPEEWLSGMEQKVSRNGKGRDMDNYSAIAVWIRAERPLFGRSDTDGSNAGYTRGLRV